MSRKRAAGAANDVVVNFIQADGHALPFPDAAFDAIWGNAILHHLDLRRAGRFRPRCRVAAGQSSRPAAVGRSLALYAVPGFWLALVLTVVFAVDLRWLPSSGLETIASGKTGLDRAADIACIWFCPWRRSASSIWRSICA